MHPGCDIEQVYLCREAKRFLEAMRERFAKFGLALHPQKTRLIEFGRYAEQRRREQGLDATVTGWCLLVAIQKRCM